MGIPAGDTRGIVTLHYLIARDDIFEDTSQHMVYSRAAIGRRWSFVQYKTRATTARVYATLKNIPVFPQA